MAETLTSAGVKPKQCLRLMKAAHIVDYIKSGMIHLIINVPKGKGPKDDEFQIRRAALEYKLPYITAIAAAHAAVKL